MSTNEQKQRIAKAKTSLNAFQPAAMFIQFPPKFVRLRLAKLLKQFVRTSKSTNQNIWSNENISETLGFVLADIT